MRITENENGFSPSERQFLLYRFLLEHTNRDRAVKKREKPFFVTFRKEKAPISNEIGDFGARGGT